MSTLVGVYERSETAKAVAEAVRTTGGTPEEDIGVDDDVATDLARTAEMDAEVADSWGSPGLGALVTADQMRGALIFILIGGAIALVPGAIVGWAFYTHTDSAVTRLLLGALVGVLFGSTVGGLIGGGMAMQSTDRPLAYEAGIAVRVDNPTDDTVKIMSEFEPIRLDRFVDGQRVETISTSGAQGVKGTMKLLRRNAKEPRHRD